MAKVKASELSKMQALLDDLQEKENLLKMYRKQFDSLCKIYFGKTMKEIEQILSGKAEQKEEPKAEQKAKQKTEQKSEPKGEKKEDDYASEFARMHGLNK